MDIRINRFGWGVVLSTLATSCLIESPSNAALADSIYTNAYEDGYTDAIEEVSMVIALAEYLSVDPQTNTITISGANLAIKDGRGGSAGSGLGNLIIGDNEGDDALLRTGCHNLVIGNNNSYRGCNGIIHGTDSSIGGEGAVVLGGDGSDVMGIHSVAIAGFENQIQTNNAAIIGGSQNTIDDKAFNSVIVSGTGNQIYDGAENSAIVGGQSVDLTASATGVCEDGQ